MRSSNAQIEIMLHESLRKAARLPKETGELPKRGRPPKNKTIGERRNVDDSTAD